MPRPEICDVCGQEIYGKPQLCLIEGAKLKVCPKCAKFGTKIRETPSKKSNISNKKVHRKRYGRKREFEEMELVENFNTIIKREREKRGWTQDELGQKLNIKGSLIKKIEGGREPTDDVRRKLENIFGINLMTVANTNEVYSYKTTTKSSELTLGDIVHLKKKRTKS
ncbi:MAG: multiprotein bridging factor aMBF1 [Candidatus Helarchaeota archaeon]